MTFHPGLDTVNPVTDFATASSNGATSEAPVGAVGAVFVLVVTYTAPLAAVDAVMPAHRRFLDEHFGAGEFLASGPLDPRTGGVIIARLPNRDRVAELVAADPFTRHGVATYEVHAFIPNRGPFALPLRDATAMLPAH